MARPATVIQQTEHTVPHLDFTIETATAAPGQRPAWRALSDMLIEATRTGTRSLYVEPQREDWRLRHRRLDRFDESIIRDPSMLLWSLDVLRARIGMDAAAIKHSQRADCIINVDETTWHLDVSISPSSMGDTWAIDWLPAPPAAPLLDDLGLLPKQLNSVRSALQTKHGWHLVGSADRGILQLLVPALIHTVTSPSSRTLSIEPRIFLPAPRTTHLCLEAIAFADRRIAWEAALAQRPDVLVLHAEVPIDWLIDLLPRALTDLTVIQIIPNASLDGALKLLMASGLDARLLADAWQSMLLHRSGRALCSQCKSVTPPNDDDIAWLANIRTSAATDVTTWLHDISTPLLDALGCENCHATGRTADVHLFQHHCLPPSTRQDLRNNDIENALATLQDLSSFHEQALHALNTKQINVAEARRLTE